MRSRGFTLLETTIAAFILTMGLVAAAWTFAVSVRTSINNHQRTIGALLLREKMEQFKAAPLNDRLWNSGGGLDAHAPIEGYFDDALLGSETPYLRIWKIDGTDRRRVTVVIYTRRAGLTNSFMELARATTVVSP